MKQSYDEMLDTENGWKECKTLGGKKSPFWWRIGHKELTIRRQFVNSAREDRRVIARNQLDKIHEYVQGRSETGLYNNVEKLAAGTEKDGLGKFMFEMFGGKDTNYGQLASHIAALFVESGVWTKNNVLRGMKFKANAVDWKPCLNAYYSGASECD